MVFEPESMFRVMTYFAGMEIWVSNLDPIVKYPAKLQHANVDVVIGVLEEHRLPDDFRDALPPYIKHHHVMVSSLENQLTSTLRTIHSALEHRHTILLYSRSPTYLTTICIAFFLRAVCFAPEYIIFDFLQPIPKTHSTWTYSFLDYLERVWPHAMITPVQIQWLRRYEQMMLEFQ